MSPSGASDWPASQRGLSATLGIHRLAAQRSCTEYDWKLATSAASHGLQKQMVAGTSADHRRVGLRAAEQDRAELLFELISQRYERGATLITSNLPFDEWTGTFGSERPTGALLDRLTHHVNILEMNGDSYRLSQSRARGNKADS